MLFNSYSFFVFFPIVVVVYFLLPKRVSYLWLLTASYYFYMGWNAKYALLLLLSTAITYISGIVIQWLNDNRPEKIEAKKWVVVGCIVANLAILFFFKYFNFTIESINAVLDHTSLPTVNTSLDVLLPVGISFYTFQALGYTVDVYRREIEAEKNFFRYALFVSFFPQLVAGPIERSKNLLNQLRNPKSYHYGRMCDGLLLMIWGYFLKLVIADRIAIFVDNVYANVDIYDGRYLLLASVLFAFQIYCDFAGYSTIAIGAAEVMGFELMENFNSPYLSQSVAEFWRRWHMSLGSLFRDYVYIPLGGNRKRQLLNIFVVWFLTGFWHGASWNFIIWGLYFGTIIYLEKKVFFKFTKKLPQVIQWFFAMIVIMVGWAIFYYVDLNSLGTFLKALVGLNNNPLYSDTLPITFMSNVTFVVLCIIASTPVPKMLFQKLNDNKVVNGNLDFVQIIFNVSLIFCIISMLVGESYNPFLYYRF